MATLESRFVKLEDLSIHYKVHGKGSNNIIFVHGWGCDINVWSHQFGAISNTRSVFIDLPGYGLSDKPKVNYTQDFFAKAVYAVLQELEIKDPILIGHSLGHPVCRQVIKNYPKLDPKLGIVDGVYFKIPKDSLAEKEYMSSLEAFANMFKGDDRAQNTKLFIQSLFIESTPQEVKNYTATYMTKVEDHVAYSTMENLIKKEVWSEEAIDVPVIAIYADIPELPSDNETYLQTLYPSLEYKEIANSGHFIMIEKPKILNKLLTDFITKD